MAEPFEKAGKWYSAFKDRHGRWRNLALQASTKSEARRLNVELHLREERIRLGIDPAPLVNDDATFGDLLTWWLEHRLRKTRGYERCAGTVRRHLIASKLAQLKPADITPGKVENFLSDKKTIAACRR